MDLTYILSREEAQRFLEGTDLSVFETSEINLDGDFVIVTMSFNEEYDSTIFVQGVKNELGYVHHETDTLVLKSTLPKEVYEHFEENCCYESLLKFE